MWDLIVSVLIIAYVFTLESVEVWPNVVPVMAESQYGST